MIFGTQEAALGINPPPWLSDGGTVGRCGCCTPVTSHRLHGFNSPEDENDGKTPARFSLASAPFHFLASAAPCCSDRAGFSLLSKK